MKLGTIHNWGENLEAYRSDLRLCSDLGYDYIGIGDSPAGWHEMFLSMAIAVEETQMATVVPMVTSPFLRHPIVTANGIASLHAMSSGRATLGFASRSEEHTSELQSLMRISYPGYAMKK